MEGISLGPHAFERELLLRCRRGWVLKSVPPQGHTFPPDFVIFYAFDQAFLAR